MSSDRTAPVRAEPAPNSSQLAMMLAAALPSLLAYNLTPSPTIFNQCLAVAGWGAALLGLRVTSGLPAARDAWAVLAALLALSAATLGSWLPGTLPSSLALSTLILLGCAAALAVFGAEVGRRADAPAWAAWFLLGLLVAAVLGALVGLVQVFAPEWTEGRWMARSGLVRRAVGNLRQPNHLSSQLAWGLVALVALVELGRLRRITAWILLPLLAGGVVLTGSRTGMVDMAVLAAWGLVDRSLSRVARAMLLAMPVVYAAGWLGMQAWNAAEVAVSGTSRGDISSSRFGIWSNTLDLIAAHPWAGVGMGEFNLAWTLTPFPGRPVAFFDHTHNLPLQLLVELGVPLGLLVLGLLGLALVQAGRRATAAQDAPGRVARPALMLVLLILLHSLLEYPLWYAYFLLPAAFAWGLTLARPAPDGEVSRHVRAGPARALGFAGACMVIGTALTVVDYLTVVDIFAPSARSAPLGERIARGQRSVLFAYHADYAALTTGEPATRQAQDLALARAPHFLLDARLMMSMARALAERGDEQGARAVADRLREFRNASAEPFFAVCDPASRPETGVAFQCSPAAQTRGWRDLARP